MYYAIDVDTRAVECMHEDGDTLARYVLDNNLQAAVFIIGDEDDLVLEFTSKGLEDLYKNLTGEELSIAKGEICQEEVAASHCWVALENNQDKFPIYTPKLAKQLLKAAEKRNKDSSSSKAAKPGKPPSTTKKTVRSRVTLDNGASIVVVNGKSKKGSILDTIVIAINEELCDTIGEVIEYITSNHTIPKTGELADTKFAEHNIKYFLKKGNISIGEEL